MIDVHPTTEVQEPERKMSRAEKRFIERASIEAQQTLSNTMSRFVDFMASADLTDESIKEKRDALSRQWKTYCTIKHLSELAFEAVATECDKIIAVYNSHKTEA